MKLTALLERHKRVVLVFLFLVSFCLRLGMSIDEYNHNGRSGWSDAVYYLDIGERFAKGDFFPPLGQNGFIVVGPVIPLLVAGAELLTGDPVWPMLILNCLLGALLVYILYGLGARLISNAGGFALSLWSVFNFSLIRYCYQILKEPLVILLLPLIILCLLKAKDMKRPVLNLIISSLAFSVLVHTDERFFVYAPAFLLFILILSGKKDKLRHAVLWLLVLMLSMVPWTLRNYKQHGELVLLTPRTTAITSKLWGSNLGGTFSEETIEMKHILGRRDHAIEVGQNNGAIPRRYGTFEKYLKSWQHYWQPTYFKLHFIQYGFRPVKWSWAHNLSSLVFYGLFLPFYLAGFVWAFLKKEWLIIFLALLPLLHGLMHTAMIWSLERYRIPMNFLVALVAMWFVKQMYEIYSNRRIGAAGEIA